MKPGDPLADPRFTPELRLQLLLSRAAWTLACHKAMLEHQAGRLTEETMARAEAAERAHNDLHQAVLELLR